jgi:hypothetical protein
LAAQNLTFLKRGSPPSDSKRPKLDNGSNDIVSMPSLAESSEGTFSGEHMIRNESSQEEGEGTGVSSLLMAAMAMTEFANERLTKNMSTQVLTAQETATHTSAIHEKQ